MTPDSPPRAGLATPGLPATFADLPDPRDPACPDGGRTRVILDASAARHIARDHVAGAAEPWADCLDAAALRALRPAAGEPDGQALALLAAPLGGQLRRALALPRALLYTSDAPDRQRGRYPEAWLVPLPCGALLAVRVGPNRPARVCTCFFPRQVRRLPPAGRGRQLVAQLVWRYAVGASDRRLHLPPAGHAVAVNRRGRPTEMQRDVRFVQPGPWGFEPGPAGVWTGVPAAFPEVGPEEPPAGAPVLRMRPRRHPGPREGQP
jgi:hypothetical protein